MGNIQIINMMPAMPEHIYKSQWRPIFDALHKMAANEFNRFGRGVIESAPIEFLDKYADEFGLALYNPNWSKEKKRRAAIVLSSAARFNNTQLYLNEIAEIIGARLVSVSASSIDKPEMRFIWSFMSSEEINSCRHMPRDCYMLISMDEWVVSADEIEWLLRALYQQLPSPGPWAIGGAKLIIVNPRAAFGLMDDEESGQEFNVGLMEV